MRFDEEQLLTGSTFSIAEKKRKSRTNIEIIRLKEEANQALESSNTFLSFLDFIEPENPIIELEFPN